VVDRELMQEMPIGWEQMSTLLILQKVILTMLN
jgi:hypothetical protein